MSPKKKVKVSSTQAEPEPVVAEPSGPGGQVADEMNGAMLSKINLAIEAILAHDAFQGVANQAADKMGTGFASRSGFDLTKCNNVFASWASETCVKQYSCAINMWSLNLLRLNIPGVPILQSSIDGLKDYYFKRPAVLPFDVIVGCENAEEVHAKLSSASAMSGQLIASSPPEILLAFILAVHGDLGTNDEELLGEWRHAMLACPI